MAGAPAGNQNRRGHKLFRDAVLRVLERRTGARKDQIAEIERIAEALVDKALEGDVPALREFADRVDGKVAQAIVGGDENDAPIQIAAKVEYVNPASG